MESDQIESEQTNNPLMDMGDLGQSIDIDDMLEGVMMNGVTDAPPASAPRPTVSVPGYAQHWSDEQNRPYWRNENTGLTTWCGPRRWLPPAPLCPPAVFVFCSSTAHARPPRSITQRLRLRRRIQPVSRSERREASLQKTASARELDFDSASPRFEQEMPLGQVPPPAPPRLVHEARSPRNSFTKKWSEEQVGRFCQ
jgi:hypothetical protein